MRLKDEKKQFSSSVDIDLRDFQGRELEAVLNNLTSEDRQEFQRLLDGCREEFQKIEESTKVIRVYAQRMREKALEIEAPHVH